MVSWYTFCASEREIPVAVSLWWREEQVGGFVTFFLLHPPTHLRGEMQKLELGSPDIEHPLCPRLCSGHLENMIPWQGFYRFKE